MELTLSRWGGLSTKQFQPECVYEESSTERRSKSRQSSRSSQPCQYLSQYWLEKIRKAFSSWSTPLGVVTVRLCVGSPLSDCPPLCYGRTAPEISEEEGSHTSRFYHWFLESSKSCLLLFLVLPGLIDTLAQLLAWRSQLWLFMTWRRRYLTQ